MRPYVDLARACAEWATGAEAQGFAAAGSGGQPAVRSVWDSHYINLATAGFYPTTRATVEASWVRPRHYGFLSFQHDASLIVFGALRREIDLAGAVRAINAAFAASLRT